ncbi:hypothetical protein [Emticicia sp. 17c]|uniref:hypothetical protein n=1 Tax=Emticicia sp. 17c TaxID=3127704 RepID=UPI00301DB7F6
MKIYIFILILFVFACSNPKESPKVEVSVPAPQKAVASSNVQTLFRSIMGNGEGLLRGVKFGDSIEEVKKVETSDLFEEEDSHVGYSFDTENLETVDILYQRNSQNRVTGIELDIYMNTDETNDGLKQELIQLFNVRYGKPVSENPLLVWKIKPNGQVSMKVIKNKLDRGLEVKFSQQPPAM